MKKQVVIIHGGDSFDSYEKYLEALKNWEVTLEWFLPRKADWKDNLPSDLGEGYEILAPRMPNKQNARYGEWKIWFERMLPFIQGEISLVGHSLGGIFLAKYLSENDFPRKISGLFLVAAPHNATEDIGDFVLSGLLEGIVKQCANVHLYQSKDDPIVSFNEFEKYQKNLPGSQFHIFEDRGHFKQEHFPELVEEIKKSYSK